MVSKWGLKTPRNTPIYPIDMVPLTGRKFLQPSPAVDFWFFFLSSTFLGFLKTRENFQLPKKMGIYFPRFSKLYFFLLKKPGVDVFFLIIPFFPIPIESMGRLHIYCTYMNG